MIRNIKTPQSKAFKALKMLGKMSVIALQVIVAFASDDEKKTRLTAGKARQLYEDGVISGAEFSEHIHGD
ncbi:MAG: hypothetical protein QM652_08945 [Legionella sp.]|uniref:hypothetical protein n=1 Tax=Legionella sp. TaxID=459 RepID=UPI0039E41E76